MQRVDFLIIGVLVVAGIGSALGALTYQDARGGGAFTVEWTTRDVAVEAAPASHSGAGDVELTVPVVEENVTRLALTVSISSSTARLQPTQVRVEVTPPDGNGSMVEETTIPVGASGNVEVPFTFDLGSVPDVDRVSAASPDAAAAQLAQEHARTNGTGEWRVVVSIAPAAPGPVGGAEAHTIGATGTATVYAANVRPMAPEVAG